MLGLAFEHGWGVEQDLERAHQYFLQAAKFRLSPPVSDDPAGLAFASDFEIESLDWDQNAAERVKAVRRKIDDLKAGKVVTSEPRPVLPPDMSPPRIKPLSLRAGGCQSPACMSFLVDPASLDQAEIIWVTELDE